MFINEIDLLIDDYDVYKVEFEKITNRILEYSEWQEIYTYLKNQHKIRPQKIDLSDFKKISDLFENAHPYLYGHYIAPLIICAEWAYLTKIITYDELDAYKKKWRSTH